MVQSMVSVPLNTHLFMEIISADLMNENSVVYSFQTQSAFAKETS